MRTREISHKASRAPKHKYIRFSFTMPSTAINHEVSAEIYKIANVDLWF
jgi:hypothetical protein